MQNQLVPNLQKALSGGARAFQAAQITREKDTAREAQQARTQGAQDVFTRLLDEDVPDQEVAVLLGQLASFTSPEIANQVRQGLNTADANQLIQQKKEAQDAGILALNIKDLGTHAEKLKAIRIQAQQDQAQGKDISGLIRLNQMNEDELNLAIDKQIGGAQTLTQILDRREKANTARIGAEQKALDRASREKIARDDRVAKLDSPFAKIGVDDFTPTSLAKFDKSRNFGDLVPVSKAPNATIMAAMLPLILGDVDFDDPQSLAVGMQQIDFISRGLSGATPKELKNSAKALAKAKKSLNDAKEKAKENPGTTWRDHVSKFAGKAVDKFMNLFNDNAPEKAQIQNLVDGPGAQGTQDAPTATLDDVRQTIPNVQVDQGGFMFIPNPRAPEGRQYLNNAAGKRIRAQ